MAEVDEVVEDARRGVAAAFRALRAIGGFVAARRATPVQRTRLGGDLPRVAPAVIGESAPAPDRDSARMGERLDQHFPGWQQEFTDSGRSPAQELEQAQQRWPNWRDGVGEVLAAVPEDRVAEVLTEAADRDAYQAWREPAPAAVPAVAGSGVDPALYGRDLDATLASIDRAAGALETGDYTDPDGRHAERPGALSVAELAARDQASAPVADAARRATERYGPLLGRLREAELGHLQKFAGGDEQKPAGTGARPEGGSGERTEGKHRARGQGPAKDTER